MSLALVFPGQGVQHSDMLLWLDSEPGAAGVLASLRRRLAADWRQRCSDDVWACSNSVAQTLVTGVSLAAWAALAPRLPTPSAVGGYSVGELAACSAAGLFDAEAALDLAAARARAMDGCAEQAQGLMAVSGLAPALLDAVCAANGVAVAIRINAQSVVLGGTMAHLQAAARALRDTSASLTWLRVRVASHTPLMAPAAAAMQATIAALPWRAGHCMVVSNVDGVGSRDTATLQRALARQIDHTVRWDLCMDTLLQRQPRCILEMGPGTSLSRLWASAGSHIPCRSVDEFRSADAVVGWVQTQLRGA